MLGFYNYTVILTYLGMFSSFVGITHVINGNIHSALVCLMISGVCDMFDGKVASTKKSRTAKEKKFGIQIDSLSDLICFGALPAIIVYITCNGSLPGFYISALYLLCALIRLAYFNVDEEERQSQTQTARTVYLGLPVTTAALIIPACMGLCGIYSWPMDKVGPAILLAMSIAFITPFRLKKPGMPGKLVMMAMGIAELVILFVGGR